MFIRKINYVWILNLMLFVAVVFMGIEQAAKGAEISKYEKSLEAVMLEKRDLSEKIFENGNNGNIGNVALTTGFVKPSDVVYINTVDIVASIK